ncbi:MAG: DMT family transporter [Nitriliruptoraceae bacterium]
MTPERRGEVVLRRHGTLAVLAAATLWGTLGIAQELGAPSAAPATVAGVRSLGGGLALVAIVVLSGGGARLAAAVRRAPGAVVGAAVSITVFQLAYLTGVRAIGVALGVLIAIGSAPAWAGLLAVLAGRRPGGRWVAATVATVAGAAVLLLVGGGDAGQDPGPFGVLAGLVAGAAYGTYTTVSVRLVQAGADGTSAVAVTFTGAGLLLLPVLVAGDLTWIAGTRGTVTVLWITLGTTAAGYALFARGLAALDAPTVTTLTLAEPLAATVLAVVLVGERLSLPGWIGATLLVVGLAAVAPISRRTRPTIGPPRRTPPRRR